MGIIKVLLTAALVFKLASSSCQPDPFIWTKIFKSNVGATVSDIAVDTENRYVFVGSFNTSLEVDQYSFQSRGLSDLFIAMTDSTGKVMWMKHWGGIYRDGQAFVETDQNNNIYVSGYFLNSTLVENQLIEVNGSGTFIAKMNSSGNLSWVKTLGPYCQLMEIKVNKDGAFGIAGFYGGAVDFGGIVSDNSNMLQNSIFFASYTTEGELNWIKSPESNSRYLSDLQNSVNIIDFDDHGNLFGAILFENDLTIDEAVYHGKKFAYNYLFLRIDKTGASNVGKVATMKDYVPPPDPSISPGGVLIPGGGDVDSEGNLSLTGLYYGKLEFPDFKLVHTNPPSVPNSLVSDLFVLRFNSSFELVWAMSFNDNAAYGKLTIGNDNQLVVSGVCGAGLINGCQVNAGLFVMNLSKEGQITRVANMGQRWEGTYNTSTLDKKNNLLISGIIGVFEDFDSKNNLQPLESSGFAGKYKLGDLTTSTAMIPIITSKKVCIYRDSITLHATPIKNASSYLWELYTGEEKKVFNTSFATLKIPVSDVPGTGEFFARVKGFSACQQLEFSEALFFRIPPHDFSEPLTIPNVITPNNGDAKNDTFKLPAALSDATVNVLNRWGNVVYSSNAYQNDWDGKDLTTGVYFVTVKSQCQREIIRSTLSIIR